MPPKNANTAAVERPFGLTEVEVTFALHACKLLIQDGKADRHTLAAETGRNAETAKRMWSQIKNKMGVTNGIGNAITGTQDGLTPTKPAPKRKSDAAGNKGRKKRVKQETVQEELVKQEEDDEEGMDDGGV